MDLSVFKTGPGAQIAQFEAGILEDLVKILLNNNQIQGETVDMQRDAAIAMSRALVAAGEQEATSMQTQGWSQIVGTTTGLLSQVVSGGYSIYQNGQASKFGNGIENVDAYTAKMAKNLEMRDLNVQVQPGAAQASPPSAVADKFLSKHISLDKIKEGAADPFMQTPEEFISKSAQAGRSTLEDLVENTQLGRREQALEKAKAVRSALEGKRKECLDSAESWKQRSQMLGQLTMGLGQGVGSEAAAGYKAEEARQNALKQIFEFLVNFAKTANETCAGTVNNTRDAYQRTLQTMATAAVAGDVRA